MTHDDIREIRRCPDDSPRGRHLETVLSRGGPAPRPHPQVPQRVPGARGRGGRGRGGDAGAARARPRARPRHGLVLLDLAHDGVPSAGLPGAGRPRPHVLLVLGQHGLDMDSSTYSCQRNIAKLSQCSEKAHFYKAFQIY